MAQLRNFIILSSETAQDLGFLVQHFTLQRFLKSPNHSNSQEPIIPPSTSCPLLCFQIHKLKGLTLITLGHFSRTLDSCSQAPAFTHATVPLHQDPSGWGIPAFTSTDALGYLFSPAVLPIQGLAGRLGDYFPSDMGDCSDLFHKTIRNNLWPKAPELSVGAPSCISSL